MDLNELPADEDGAETGNPMFCTQIPHAYDAIFSDLPTIAELQCSLEETHIEEAPNANEDEPAIAIGILETEIADVDLQFLAKISSPEEPYVGKMFDTVEDAKKCYNEYARKKGFSVRTGTSRRSAITKELDKVLFVCNKEGKGKQSKADDEETIQVDEIAQGTSQSSGSDVDEWTGKKAKCIGIKRKREKMKYTNCKARMLIKFNGNKWFVKQMVADHNHSLVDKPSLSKFLRSHAGIPQEEVQFLTIMHECNLETSRMMQLMSMLYGSAHSVPYHEKHLSNLRAGIRAHAAKSDMSETLDYFYELTKEDSGFFFKVKVDADDKVENIFWVDGAAREVYRNYNDCISFDSTYLTNMYKMPFAPFIAINRHGQTIQVGCAFLRNETTDAYVWLFEAFLEAMNGIEPVNIITDQDLAMAAAIRAVFVATRHRCCRWHIISKIETRLGVYFSTKKGLEEDYNEIVNYSLSPEEFESRWEAMINVHEAAENEILSNLYQIRHLWVPAYFMDRFYPFLQSTQRSESFNGVLKKYVNPHNSVLDFVHQYKRIQDKTDVAEDKQDYRTDQKLPPPWSRFPLEKHAIQVYTRNIYYRVRAEFEKIAQYVCRQMHPNVYQLSPIEDFVGGYGSRLYEVTYNEEHALISCQCCKYERDGIFCCHILKVLTDKGVKKIPDHYILPRWTPQENPTSITAVQANGQRPTMPEKSKRAVRFANLAHQFTKIAHQASVSDELTQIATNHARAIEAEFSALKKAKRDKKKAQEARTKEPVQQQEPGQVQQQESDIAEHVQQQGSEQVQRQASERAKQVQHQCDPIHEQQESTTIPTPIPPPEELLHWHLSQQNGEASVVSNTPVRQGLTVMDPTITKTKGRERRRRYKSSLEVHSKRKPNKCSVCGSTEHNAATCAKKRRVAEE